MKTTSFCNFIAKDPELRLGEQKENA